MTSECLLDLAARQLRSPRKPPSDRLQPPRLSVKDPQVPMKPPKGEEDTDTPPFEADHRCTPRCKLIQLELKKAPNRHVRPRPPPAPPRHILHVAAAHAHSVLGSGCADDAMADDERTYHASAVSNDSEEWSEEEEGEEEEEEEEEEWSLAHVCDPPAVPIKLDSKKMRM